MRLVELFSMILLWHQKKIREKIKHEFPSVAKVHEKPITTNQFT